MKKNDNANNEVAKTNATIEKLKDCHVLRNCQFRREVMRKSKLCQEITHYNMVLVNAGLYVELSCSKEYKWSFCIGGEMFEGTKPSEFYDLANKYKKELFNCGLDKDSKNKDYLVPVYVWDLAHVIESFGTCYEYFNGKNEAKIGGFILRDVQSVTGVTCIQELQEEFLKVDKMENAVLFTKVSELMFKTMVLDSKENGGTGKIFKTIASKAKHEIIKYSDKDLHGCWMRRCTPYLEEYDFIRHQCFRASVVMKNNKYIKREINGEMKNDSVVMNNVVSWDQSSAHAHKAICKKFPIKTKPRTPSTAEPDYHNWHCLNGFNYYLEKYFCWFEIEFTGLKLNGKMAGLDPFNTYLNYNIEKDMTLCFDSNQWEGFQLFYEWEYMEVKRLVIAETCYLPDWARKAISQLYINKATYPTKDAIRNMLKVFLNSASYGCTIERVWDYYEEDGSVKDFSNCDWYHIWEKRILPPQVGTTIASYVMLDEMRIIAQVPYDFAYCDTDSVKAVNSEKLTGIIDEHNSKVDDEIKAACEKLALDYNVMQELGKYQNDGMYTKFKAISKKEYIYETDKGKLGAHCAGYASHFPNYDFDDEDTSIVFKYFTKRFFEPNIDKYEKKRIPVILFEPLYKQVDPFDYFTVYTKYSEYVNVWLEDKKRYKKVFYKFDLYEFANYINTHSIGE